MVPSTNTTEIREGTDRGPSTDRAGAFVTSTGRSLPAVPEGGNAPRTATECRPHTHSHQAAHSCQLGAASLDRHMDTPVVKCPQHWSPRPTPPIFWREPREDPPPPLNNSAVSEISSVFINRGAATDVAPPPV